MTSLNISAKIDEETMSDLIRNQLICDWKIYMEVEADEKIDKAFRKMIKYYSSPTEWGIFKIENGLT